MYVLWFPCRRYRTCPSDLLVFPILGMLIYPHLAVLKPIRVFHLVALPRLVKLVLAYNLHIDNDSVAVLIAFTKLRYLDLVGTGFDMIGARRLATASFSRESTVILPVVCGKHLSSTLFHFLISGD